MAKVRGEFTLDCGPRVKELIADAYRAARVSFGKRFARLGGQGYDVSTPEGVIPELVVMVFPERQVRDAHKELERLKQAGEIDKVNDWTAGIPEDHRVPLMKLDAARSKGNKKASSGQAVLAVWLCEAKETVKAGAISSLNTQLKHLAGGLSGVRVLGNDDTRFFINASAEIPKAKFNAYGQISP
jgi:hypothetical protein